MGTILDQFYDKQEEERKAYLAAEKLKKEANLEEKAREFEEKTHELAKLSYEVKAKRFGNTYKNEYEFIGVFLEEFGELRDEFQCVRLMRAWLLNNLQRLPMYKEIYKNKVAELSDCIARLIGEAVDLQVCCDKFLERYK